MVSPWHWTILVQRSAKKYQPWSVSSPIWAEMRQPAPDQGLGPVVGSRLFTFSFFNPLKFGGLLAALHCFLVSTFWGGGFA
jgi:hypothetical protein